MSKFFRLCLGVVIMSFSVYSSSWAFSRDKADHYIEENNLETNKQDDIDKIDVQEVMLDVPLLNQMDPPRLKSGCEVTALAMILIFRGIPVTKNQLAEEIVKVPFKYYNGQYGNPNAGFVGKMEGGPGLGAYHGPIFELANKYIMNKVKDYTNQPFELLLKEVAAGNPVWIITTKTFEPVSDIQTWQTPQGPVDVTMSMHSVVITGYDPENIYINNPYGIKNQKLERESFIQAWEQMGEQAIVIY